MTSARFCPIHRLVLEELWTGSKCPAGHWQRDEWLVADCSLPEPDPRWLIAIVKRGRMLMFMPWFERFCLEVEDCFGLDCSSADAVKPSYDRLDARRQYDRRLWARKKAMRLGLPVPEWAALRIKPKPSVSA